MTRVAVVLGGAILAFGIFSGAAGASELVASFDPGLGEFPEGIAVDPQGTLYVTIAPLGQVRRLEEDGSWSLVHQFQPGGAGLEVLGLAADKRGTIYVAVPSLATSAHGVWALPADGGPAERLPGSQNIAFPNGIAIDEHGVLYVTDSVLGAVWRLEPGGEAPDSPWLQDETLAGTGFLNGAGAPIGANGIAYVRGRLLVANTEKRQVVAIRVERTGAPGTPSVVHSFAAPLDLLDGIAADVAGNAYVVVGGNRLVRLDPSGNETVVATHEDDGLTVPASLTFGTRGEEKRTLYLTNLSLPPLVALAFGPGEPLAPGVVAVEVPLPGPPLP